MEGKTYGPDTLALHAGFTSDPATGAHAVPIYQTVAYRVAAFEGGTGALAVSSGMAAISLALLTITELGDEIVAANNLYGGTYQLFNHTLPKLGRNVSFVDSTKPEEFRKAITEKTKAIYAETIGNPKLDVPDLETIAKIAHEAGIPLIVDNTAGIGLIRPFDFGADRCHVRNQVPWRARDFPGRDYCGFGEIQLGFGEVPGVHGTGPWTGS